MKTFLFQVSGNLRIVGSILIEGKGNTEEEARQDCRNRNPRLIPDWHKLPLIAEKSEEWICEENKND